MYTGFVCCWNNTGMAQKFRNICIRTGLQCVYHMTETWFGLVSLFNGISTFLGYLIPKPSFEKNSSGTI